LVVAIGALSFCRRWCRRLASAAAPGRNAAAPHAVQCAMDAPSRAGSAPQARKIQPDQTREERSSLVPVAPLPW